MLSPAALPSAVREYRPHQIFDALERQAARNHQISLILPTLRNGIGYGSPNFLETICLLALIKLKTPRRIFEFGTFLGSTSAMLALNLPDATIVTLDLPRADINPAGSASPATHSGHQEDADLRRISRASSGIVIARERKEGRGEQIIQMYHDSLKFRPGDHGFEQSFDVIFIDGGHDTATIAADTRNAFAMARSNALIVWHDYRSPLHTDVARFLDDLSAREPIGFLGGTTLAFCWAGHPLEETA